MAGQVLIIGAGFAGIRAARALKGTDLEVTVIDRQNYHLFQPLLYQVATAGLEQESIAHPVRAIFRDWKNVRFRMGEVVEVDLAARLVRMAAGDPLSYDYLIIAAGAATNFFGLESVERAAFELKDLDDAVTLRNRILRAFEEAAGESDPARRRSLLTFVIVGGGPTGIEFAGALMELINSVLLRDFPEFSRDDVKVVLAEAADRLLTAYTETLGVYARKRLERIGVTVALHNSVKAIEENVIHFADGTTLPAHTLMWTAGVKAAPLADRIDAPKARAGRFAVGPGLTLPDHPEVFAVGDIAYLEQDGRPLSAMAPVAMQMGEYAGKAIRQMAGGRTPRPFRYLDKGTMAVIGRGKAVASVFGVNLTGFPAWLTWLALHLYYLIDFRNRLVVLLNWAYDYFLFERKVRLIIQDTDTGHLPALNGHPAQKIEG